MPQTTTTTMTIPLPVDTNDRLEALAKVIHIPRDALAAHAIVEYPDLREYQIKSIQEAVEEADSPNAKFLEHDEVVEHMKKLGYG